MGNWLKSYNERIKTFLVTGDEERGERYRRKHRGEDCSILRHSSEICFTLWYLISGCSKSHQKILICPVWTILIIFKFKFGVGFFFNDCRTGLFWGKMTNLNVYCNIIFMGLSCESEENQPHVNVW